jgi:TfdA family taurine catabolism dioxygenase TauD
MTASAQGISNLDHDSELVRQGEQTSAVPIEQPALAHRQLVQTAARARFVALCGFDPASRRTCGHIEFVDERATYDAVPDEMKRRLDRLVAEQSIFNSRARLAFTNFGDEERQQMPAVPQVLARTIPEPGRKSLYLAPDAGRIFGMPDQEGRA